MTAEPELIALSEHEGVYATDPGQVRFVRSALREMLDGCPRADDVILVVSELAANAVVHSCGDLFTVRCEVHRDHVYVVVEDQGRWVPQQQVHDDRPHGLEIVNALAHPTNWGVMTCRGGGTRAWARLFTGGHNAT
jgi:anti-sigma regulatory factor (Ser/Thr protein kinase)